MKLIDLSVNDIGIGINRSWLHLLWEALLCEILGMYLKVRLVLNIFKIIAYYILSLRHLYEHDYHAVCMQIAIN